MEPEGGRPRASLPERLSFLGCDGCASLPGLGGPALPPGLGGAAPPPGLGGPADLPGLGGAVPSPGLGAPAPRAGAPLGRSASLDLPAGAASPSESESLLYSLDSLSLPGCTGAPRRYPDAAEGRGGAPLIVDLAACQPRDGRGGCPRLDMAPRALCHNVSAAQVLGPHARGIRASSYTSLLAVCAAG
jgi:hypothetical protein